LVLTPDVIHNIPAVIELSVKRIVAMSEINDSLFAELGILFRLQTRGLLLHLVEAFDIIILVDARFCAEVFAQVEDSTCLDELLVASALACALHTLHDVV